MAKIKITLEDDSGQPLTAPRAYALEVGAGTLAEIEQVERQTRERLLSDQTIWTIVVDKAAAVSQQQQRAVEAILQDGPMPSVSPHVDLYDPREKEVLLFDHALQVQQQKPNRDQKERPARTRISTDVMRLENKAGGFNYLTAGINEQGEEIVSLEDVVKAQIISEYSGQRGPLKIVAITDGAESHWP